MEEQGCGLGEEPHLEHDGEHQGPLQHTGEESDHDGEGQAPLQYTGEEFDAEGACIKAARGGQRLEHGDVPLLNTADMAEAFSEEPDTAVLQYFVNSDPADPEVVEHVGGLDPGVVEPTSITQFLTLPTVTRQRHTKFKDPIFDFAQSKFLTSDEFSTAAEELRMAKQLAEIAKQQQRHQKEDSKRRKALEREEWRVAKAAAREEAARLKELRAAEQAELQAQRRAMREEVERARVQRIADAAAAKAAKAAERARKALERQEQQRLRAARAAEMAQGCQGGGSNEDTIGGEPEVHRTHIASSIPEQFPQFPAPQNIPYFFSASPTFPPMTSSAHLSFQQLNTHMQSMQPSHPMLQFSSSFQVFQNSLTHNSH
jgi:hypothetical protein